MTALNIAGQETVYVNTRIDPITLAQMLQQLTQMSDAELDGCMQDMAIAVHASGTLERPLMLLSDRLVDGAVTGLHLATIEMRRRGRVVEH